MKKGENKNTNKNSINKKSSTTELKKSNEEMNKIINFQTELKQTGLSQEQIEEILNRMKEKIGKRRVIVFMGKTGSGKSKTCNALFGIELFKTNPVRPETKGIQLNNVGNLTLIDVPGVGEADALNNEQWEELYKTLLTKGVPVPVNKPRTYLPVDLIVWLIKADDRSLQVDAEFYNNIFKKYCSEDTLQRVVYAVSQADKIEPIRGEGGWNDSEKKLGYKQIENVELKKREIANIFGKSPNNIIAYSAAEGYNLDILLEEIVYMLPKEAVPLVVRKVREHEGKTKKKIINKKVEEREKESFWEIAEEVGEFVAGPIGRKAVKVVRNALNFIWDIFWG